MLTRCTDVNGTSATLGRHIRMTSNPIWVRIVRLLSLNYPAIGTAYEGDPCYSSAFYGSASPPCCCLRPSPWAPLKLRPVATGAHLFATATFGGNGRTCEGCHNGGGKASGQLEDRKLPSLLNTAAIYPRFSPGVGKVITLEGQVQSCIKGGLAGTPPELGSPDLVALTAYLGSIAKGQPVEIGGTPK